ncbi:GSCFA domain-containing protein [Gramella sp. GC03-9]|uniref:GSCFA domain-containing protein n=1 Tax=Christiangramia oceanisediminis TaxID=2920386 RepID=A0A9X2I3E8_9FLAO|nr:GSCFA domain-containing protein [Gramella oceanisediminis]MCP9198617.1 GSCFA domain-containing protein [Gramella oceanisediminis]
MDFRTKTPIEEGMPKIDHKKGVFLIGSCFVENIGAKMDWFKFKSLQNPTGIIFHPSPIRKFFQRLSNHEAYTEKDVFEFNEGWQSLEAHSVMRRETREACLHALNNSLDESRKFLADASHVIISLGTAWGYTFEAKPDIVANCHKVPQKMFQKELSSVDEIVNDLEVISHSIAQLSDKPKLILTISPVRHLKDGLVQNQRSKAHLITAVHRFVENAENAAYFPSYEILMDELRDYRFYADDMLHPSSLAIEYIWKLFSYSYLTAGSRELNLQIDKIQKALSHRSREGNSVNHRKFLTRLQAKIEEINKKYPEITFSQPL